MALLKAFKNKYDGKDCLNGYWKVAEININLLKDDSHITLVGYVDKTARDAESQPVETRSFDFTKETNPFTLKELDKLGVNAVKIAYSTIKSQTTTDAEGKVVAGEFNEATDI